MATVSMHATVTTALGGGLEVSVPQRLLPRPSPLDCNKNSSLSTAAAAAREPARTLSTSAVSENAGGSSELQPDWHLGKPYSTSISRSPWLGASFSTGTIYSRTFSGGMPYRSLDCISPGRYEHNYMFQFNACTCSKFGAVANGRTTVAAKNDRPKSLVGWSSYPTETPPYYWKAREDATLLGIRKSVSTRLKPAASLAQYSTDTEIYHQHQSEMSQQGPVQTMLMDITPSSNTGSAWGTPARSTSRTVRLTYQVRSKTGDVSGPASLPQFSRRNSYLNANNHSSQISQARQLSEVRMSSPQAAHNTMKSSTREAWERAAEKLGWSSTKASSASSLGGKTRDFARASVAAKRMEGFVPSFESIELESKIGDSLSGYEIEMLDEEQELQLPPSCYDLPEEEEAEFFKLGGEGRRWVDRSRVSLQQGWVTSAEQSGKTRGWVETKRANKAVTENRGIGRRPIERASVMPTGNPWETTSEPIQRGRRLIENVGVPQKQVDVVISEPIRRGRGGSERVLSLPQKQAKHAIIEPTGNLDVIEVEELAPDTSAVEATNAGEPFLNKSVMVIDTLEKAKVVLEQLMGEYRHLVHACDTEVAGIDVKKESPVGHGCITCLSIYCGPSGNFGEGKNCLWIDVLDGGEDVLRAFKCYFEDPSIKKVWHNYSFDKHILSRHGIHAQGFYADTMHLARLWDSARRGTQGGYSLEALTSDEKVMDGLVGVLDKNGEMVAGKRSMKTLFGKANIRKDGTPGKLRVIPPVEELQRAEDSRELWIHYSAYDAVCTFNLWQSLQEKLKRTPWKVVGLGMDGSMYDFYEEYWQPFGELLVKMEADGMLVDCNHLAEIEKIALSQQKLSVSRFRKWAAKYCPDAALMNVGSDAQIRQLLWGGVTNRKDAGEMLPKERVFNVPNTDGFIEEGKKVPKKTRPICIRGIDVDIPIDAYTAAGWPAVGGAAMKALAGKVAIEYSDLDSDSDLDLPEDVVESEALLTSAGVEGEQEEDISVYGKAYAAFGGGQEGKEACMALAALCEVASINTLISNFIQPLQGGDIKSVKDGRVHCSININTETGRLSARRPSLQNQPALEKDRYKIRQAFVASPGKSLIVADYGQDMFASERRKAKMLNFSIAYGKTAMGLSKDWKVSLDEAKQTLNLWYSDRPEVLAWQQERREEAHQTLRVHTLLGRTRHLPDVNSHNKLMRSHMERAAINTPVQGSAADVAMCAMLEINRSEALQELGWKLLLQVHDEVILEGPEESAEIAKDLVVHAMMHPFNGKNFLDIELAVDANFAGNWYAAK
ncbi:hypothetical protein BDL97_02G024900 [Sphagnum fallax]|nr:hypothetical protein BDL97_02G024900 [Sphagnum fallax]